MPDATWATSIITPRSRTCSASSRTVCSSPPNWGKNVGVIDSTFIATFDSFPAGFRLGPQSPWLDEPSRISRDDRPRRDVLGHDGTCSHDRPFSDGNARAYKATRRHPSLSADRYRVVYQPHRGVFKVVSGTAKVRFLRHGRLFANRDPRVVVDLDTAAESAIPVQRQAPGMPHFDAVHDEHRVLDARAEQLERIHAQRRKPSTAAADEEQLEWTPKDPPKFDRKRPSRWGEFELPPN